MRKTTLVVLVIFTGLATPVAAHDALLARLAGDWTGRGTMKLTPTAEPERVFCKITNTLSDSGNTLSQKGRCSLASNSGAISGSIASVGSNLYSGTLSSLASRGAASLAGSGLPNRIELNADYVDAVDGARVRALITLQLTGNGYTLSSTRVDAAGEAYLASEIVFSKE